MYTRPERVETARYNMYVATGNVCANAHAENSVFRPGTSLPVSGRMVKGVDVQASRCNEWMGRASTQYARVSVYEH